jgi:DNA-directed RNA polymerase specialized sigma24 family protein
VTPDNVEMEGGDERLNAVAYKVLGSRPEADDAVHETWLRLSRNGVGGRDNMTGWLTIVLGRVCVDVLRSRNARCAKPLDGWPPELIVGRNNSSDPADHHRPAH